MDFDHVSMATNGRLVIPARVRDQLGMAQGGSFAVHVENGSVRLEPMAQAIAEVQALVRAYVPDGISLSAELIADRRAAAARE
jgi:AbrB family looped-hinge helix DNA binding protein